MKEAGMTTAMKQAYWTLRNSCGRFSLKDDPLLLRLVINTETPPTEALKDEMSQLFPAYFIIWGPNQSAQDAPGSIQNS